MHDHDSHEEGGSKAVSAAVERNSPQQPRNWDDEHLAGRWSFLSAPAEQGRLALVAALCQLHGNDTLIDVGCARGQLRRWLDPRVFQTYVGVDISSAAFAGADSSDIASEWLAMAIEDYHPPVARPRSAVVFSEILYCVDRPAAEVARLCHALDAACAIVSMTVAGTRHPHYRDRVTSVWRAIDRLRWHRAADVTLADRRGGERWRIAALIPS